MAVVDSCVLILLSRVGRLSLLRYFKKVSITPEIYNEVVKEAKGKHGASEVEKACKDWINITEIESKEIREVSKLEGVSYGDLSIILLADELKDIFLTNDRVLIQIARSKGIECYWLTTFLLKLVKEGMVKKEDAKNILFDLIGNGMRLRIEVYTAILRRIDDI